MTVTYPSSPVAGVRPGLTLERIAEFAETVGPYAERLPEKIVWNGGDWMAKPFVQARLDGGKLSIRGVAAWFGGHVLRLTPDGATDGIFAAWLANEHGIEVRNDRYGMYPLYYFSTEQEFAASPFLLTLLALGAPKELDDEALAVFVRWGCFPGEMTPFKHIHALPPGCRLSWSHGMLQVSGGIVNAVHRDIERSAAVDGYIDLFAQAIKRRTPRGRMVLPLSGGRDSRHILLELLRQGRVPDPCVTMRHFPPRPNNDLELASEVVKIAGVPHRVVDNPASFARTEVEKNFWTDLCADDHTIHLALSRALASIGPGTLYDGIGGDILSSIRKENWLQLFRAGDYEQLAEQLLRPEREKMLAAMLEPEAYRRFGRTVARNAVMAELPKHAHQPNPVGSFGFSTRARRSLALIPYRIHSPVSEVFAPYVDRDLFDFVTSLPASMLLGRQFHIDVIYRAFPKFADLPFAKGYEPGPVREDRWFNRRLAGEVLARLTLRRSSAFLRRTHLALRLAKYMWKGTNRGFKQDNLQRILYLVQLEDVAGG